MEKKYKLAISILTRNRKAFVEELLERLSMALYDRNIGLYLLDGSDKNELGEIIENYKNHGFDNIHYRYYSSVEYGEDVLFQRFEDGGPAVDAEYVWRCSDKFVPSKQYLDIVLEQLDKDYDIIVYNVMYRNGEQTKEYYNKVEFFKECAPKLQMLCVPILGRKIIEGFTKENMRKTMEQMKYTEVDNMLHSIADINNFRGLLLCGDERNTPMRIRFTTKEDDTSGHVKEALTFEWFVERVYNTVNELPPVYDREKRYVMKEFSCHTWFSLEGFLNLRWKKGYNFKQCFQYMNKLKYVTNIPVIIVLGIAILPPPLSRFLYKRVCLIKNMFHIQHF